MGKFSAKTKRMVLWVLVGALALGIAWAGWKYLLRPWLFPPSPLVVTPKVGLEQLQAKSLYYTSEARDYLRALRPDLLAEDDRTPEQGPRANGYAQATQDVGLFEALNGRYQFDTLLLLGDVSTFQNLLSHLLEREPEKRVFHLVYVDHWMMVFKRGNVRDWTPADLADLRAKMGSLHSDDRARFLAKTADRVRVIGYVPEAKQWLDEAMAADNSSPDALAGMAGYYITAKQWAEAEKYADKALEEAPDYPAALQRKYTANMGSKHVIDAFKVSEKLMKMFPNNPAQLLQHASVAHSAHRYDAEAAALEKYLALAEAQGRIDGIYEFGAAKAYAMMATQTKVGMDKNVDLAVQHFRKALKTEALTPEQREDAIETLKKAAQAQAERKK